MTDFDKIALQYGITEPANGWEAHDRRVEAQYAKAGGTLLADRLVAIGVPARVHGPILEGYSDTKAVKGLREFYRGNNTICVLAGSPGCGKTLAASAWLLNAELKQSPKYLRPRRFITAPEFCRIDSFDREEFSKIEKAALLVVDDLGEEYADKRSYFANLFANLLTSRHGSMLPTVITSNLSVQEIAKEYGGRVESRLNDALVLQLFDEQDLREVTT